MVITVMLSAGTNGWGFDRRFQLTENKITQNTVTCEWLKRTITLALVTLNLIETQTDQGRLNEPWQRTKVTVSCEVERVF